MNFIHIFISLSLIIDSQFLISATIELFFNSIAELIISIEIPSKEANAEIKIHPVIAEAKCSSVQYKYKAELCKTFCAFCPSIHFSFSLFLPGNCFVYIFYLKS